MRQRFPFMYTVCALALVTAIVLAMCSGCTVHRTVKEDEPDGRRCLCLCKTKDTTQPCEEAT